MRFFKPTIYFLTLLISFFIASSASAAITLRPALNLGLVGYWAMEEGTGIKAGDSSGNGNTGTLYGDPVAVPIASDNFNRSDEVPIAGNWSRLSTYGRLQLSGNRALLYDGWHAFAYWNANTFNDNQYSQATVTEVDGTGGFGLMLRANPTTGTAYFIRFWGGTLSLCTWDGNYDCSNIASRYPAVGEVVRFEAIGSTFRVYIDGIQIGTDVTDTTYSSGYPGMFVYEDGNGWDNWEGGNMTFEGWTDGKRGKAFSFDGTNDYVDAGDLNDSAKTVSFWMNANSTTEDIMDMNSTATIGVSAGTIAANNFGSAISYNSSEHFSNGAAANTGTFGLTIPSGTTFAVVGITAYSGSSNYISNGTVSIDSVGMTPGYVTDNTVGAWMGMLYYLPNPSTGSVNLAWDFAGTTAPYNGDVAAYVYYLTGVDTASPVRDSGGQNLGGGSYTTGSLANPQSGDMSLGLTWSYNSSDMAMSWNNGTEIREDFHNPIDNSIMYHSPTGATTYTATTGGQGDDGGISVLVLKPSGSGSATIYVDGVESSTVTTGWHHIAIVSGTGVDANAFKIGKVGSGYFDGKLDEVRIYNRALSATEIAGLYQSGSAKILASDDTGLVGYWSMEEGTGTQAGDSSGNGNDGTVFSKVASDNFGRASLGSEYTAFLNWGNLVISSNQLAASTSYDGSYRNDYAGGEDQYNQIALKVVGGASNNDIGISARVQSDEETEYIFATAASSFGTSAEIGLYRRVAASSTTLVTDTYTFSADDVMKISTVGSDPVIVKGYVNGVEVLSYSDSHADRITGGYPGWYLGNTTYRLDNAEWGTVSGTWTVGKSGKALDFNGTGDYIEVEDPSDGSLDFGASQDFTAVAWVKTTQSAALNQWPQIISKISNAPKYGYEIGLHDSTDDSKWYGAIEVNGTGYGVDGSSDVADGQWHQLVLMRSGSNILTYEDGAYANTTAASSASVANSTNLRIGAYSNGSPIYLFDGSIDEVRVYNRALDSTEIAALYASSGKRAEINSSQNSRVTDGLVGLWSFNGPDVNMATNTAYDRSGNNNNGTLTGGPTQAIGKVGQALDFDGASDYVDISSDHTVTSDNWAVSAWVKPTSYSGGDGAHKYIFLNSDDLDTGGSSGFDLLMEIATGAPRLTVMVGTESQENLPGPSALPLGVWTHIVGVKNGTALSIYVNGVLAGNTTLSSSTMDYVSNAPATRIGQRSDSDGNFPGLIDEVRIYDRALSAGEIQQLYNMSVPTFRCGDPLTFTYKGSTVTYGTVNVSGQCWMDRNLGASQVATAYNNSASYGDYFQWGRLDDGHQTSTSGTTATLSGSDVPGHGNFILSNASPFDWRSPQNDNLWQAASSYTNNPCPSGWHIPLQAEWSTAMTNLGLASCSSNCLAAMANSSLKIPTAGERDRNDGALYNLGTSGYYWSSSPNSTNAYSLAFDSSLVGPAYVYSRAFGFSARCLKN